jgi:hypothetical protein
MSSIGGVSMAMMQTLLESASMAATATADLCHADSSPDQCDVSGDLSALLAAKGQTAEVIQMEHEVSANAARPLGVDVLA